MTSPFRRRRLRDRLLAVALAVVVVVVGLVVYHSSDIRNANLVTGRRVAGPVSPSVLPTSLTQRWTAATNAEAGTVASAAGVVVTTDQHTVTAHDAVTGAVRWTYTRSNRTLCTIGSGDVGPTNMTSSSSVTGITTVYEENGFCSQVMTFDPVTGARGRVRTSPNEPNGSLTFGGPYAAWLGSTRVEVWRYDLLRTIQYGDQINPPKSGQSRLGCIFTDLALASNQFATVEHCAAEGKTARVVLNFDDPGGVSGHPTGWDVFQHTIRVDIDTHAAAARIVGVTADRVAVLVSGPKPAVVVYDATGKQISRTLVDMPAAEIIAADDIAKPATVTPAVQTAGYRYSFVGGHVLAISTPTIKAVAPTTSFPATATTSSSSPSSSSGSITDSLDTPPTVDIVNLELNWVAAGAIGLPGTIGSTVLMPTKAGLSSFNAATGPLDLSADGAVSTPVDRGGYVGRVDVSAIGKMIIEDRGATVVALS